MSAAGITDTLVEDVENGRHDVIVCNFANADMVGHTGNLDAAIRARLDARRLPGPHSRAQSPGPAAR